jgi:hypothetical protein
MKRIFLVLLILSKIFFTIYAQGVTKDSFEFRLNYGNVTGGMNFFSNEYDFEASISLINLFIRHSKTNIGFEVTPLKYIANYSVNMQKWNQNLYFLNGNLYWNPFNIENIILGPFVSINYLSVENWSEFNTNGYILSSGVRFLLKDWKQPFQIIGSEIGYRNISGKHSFYLNLSLDVTILAGFIIGSLSAEASEVKEANEDYERQISGTGPFVPKEPKQPKPPFQNDKEIK